MIKMFLLLFRVLTASILFVTVSGCSMFQLKRPEIEVQSVVVKSVSFETMTMTINLQVDNPNDRDINVEKLSYLLELNGQKFNEENVNGQWKFAKKSKSDIAVPISVKLASVLQSLQFLKNGDNHVRVTGTASVNNLRIPFKGEKTLKIDL